MKLSVGCPQCLEESGLPQSNLDTVELEEDGIYKFICPEGHETYTYLQNQKFELLFESGSLALIAGYPREAVSSIVASFERFLEFYIKLILKEKRISEEVIRKTWKLVSNASERQLGAFIFIKTLIDGDVVNFNLEKYSKFRNKVIHKGYFPKSDEVIGFAQPILDFIGETLKELHDKHGRSIQYYKDKKIDSLEGHIPEGAYTSTMVILPTISLYASYEQLGKINYRQRLNQLKRFRMHEFN